MENILVFIPMIGGILVAIIAVVMDSNQKRKKQYEKNTITQIISTDDMPIEEIVKSILKIQLKHQEKDIWIERIIGFLMGIVSSLIVSVALYYLGIG